MNKELKAFELIKNITYDRTDLYGIEVFREALNIIETTLKDYVQLKINYSELQDINAFYACECKDKLTVLEIIKRDPVMVCVEYYKCIVELKLTYQEYLKYFPDEKDRAIKSEKEYELLKEVLS